MVPGCVTSQLADRKGLSQECLVQETILSPPGLLMWPLLLATGLWIFACLCSGSSDSFVWSLLVPDPSHKFAVVRRLGFELEVLWSCEAYSTNMRHNSQMMG